MEKKIVAWLNGSNVDWMDCSVSPLSQSFSRASAVFEVMSVVPAVKGTALICLDEHVDRFFSSAERTYMKLPFSQGEIKDAIVATARANSVSNGLTKFYAYYSDIDLGSRSPHNVSVAIFCLDYGLIGTDPARFSTPLKVGISIYRKLHPETAAVHAKVVGNYVNGYLARTEVRLKGFDEALMLDTDGFVAEGPTSNIFFARGACVVTPPKENVLPGITRKVVMDVLRAMGYMVKETRILPKDLCGYDEAFFSGTLRHVQPILRIEDQDLTCPGPVTKELMSRIKDVYSGKIESFGALLTYID